MIFQQKYVEQLYIGNDSFLDRCIKIRKIVYVLLEEPQSSTLAKYIQSILLLTIALSFVQIFLDSLYDGQQYNDFSYYCELCIFTVFSVELLLRLMTFTAFGDRIIKFLQRPLNFIDILSIGLGLTSLIQGQSSLNGLRMLKLFKSIRIVKLNRYIKGIDILQQSVGQSFKQFYYLIIGFLIISLAYGVAIYYCELAAEYQQLSMGNSIWLGIVTMTSVGYGDIVPKSIEGMIITSLMALIANTVIFSLPIAILDMDFQETYDKRVEEKKIKQLKYHQVGTRRNSVRNNELKFFNSRLELIEKRNKEIQCLLDQSNLMAKELTNDLKLLFESINKEEEEELVNDQELGNSNTILQSTPQVKLSGTQILLMKAELYGKLMKAKKKIQITNIFRNLTKDTKFYNHNSSIPPIKLFSYKNTKRILIKSHSLDNENQLLKLRNEEYGNVPYDFLNEVFLQIQEDIGNVNQPIVQQRRSAYYQNQSDQCQRQLSFGAQLLSENQEGGDNGQFQNTSFLMNRSINMDRKSQFKRSMTVGNDNEEVVKSVSEHSSVKKNRRYNYKEIEDFKEKQMPKSPHCFMNESNNLKELGNKKKPSRKLQISWNDLDLSISPSNISRAYLKREQQFKIEEYEENQSVSFSGSYQ